MVEIGVGVTADPGRNFHPFGNGAEHRGLRSLFAPAFAHGAIRSARPTDVPRGRREVSGPRHAGLESPNVQIVAAASAKGNTL